MTPAASAPPQPSDGALIGVSVALAVLMASVVGACVPVVVCTYLRSRHSRQETTERYMEYLHVYITFCIYSVGCNTLRCSSVMHVHKRHGHVYAKNNIYSCVCTYVIMWYLCVHRTNVVDSPHLLNTSHSSIELTSL